MNKNDYKLKYGRNQNKRRYEHELDDPLDLYTLRAEFVYVPSMLDGVAINQCDLSPR